MSTVPNLLAVYYLPYFGSSFSAERVMLLSVDVFRLNRVITVISEDIMLIGSHVRHLV